MVSSSIIEKIQEVFDQSTYSERDVVYVLSRIRKVLEIDNKKGQFKILSFYCNWALHSRIDDTSSIEGILTSIESDINAHVDFFVHKPFKDELRKFLSEYKITSDIFSNASRLRDFSSALLKVYSDTPLYVKTSQEEIVITLKYKGENNYEIEINKKV